MKFISRLVEHTKQKKTAKATKVTEPHQASVKYCGFAVGSVFTLLLHVDLSEITSINIYTLKVHFQGNGGANSWNVPHEREAPP